MGKTAEPPVMSTEGSGTKIPGQTETSDETDTEPEPESTITRPPFRVRYFGDYELLGEIAHGGMGIVYRGRQVSLGRPVALTMILPNKLDDDAFKRFRLEAESAANPFHCSPCIAGLLSFYCPHVRPGSAAGWLHLTEAVRLSSTAPGCNSPSPATEPVPASDGERGDPRALQSSGHGSPELEGV
jgi:hypothetical protein